MSDLAGQRFGYLTVLEPDISRTDRKYWKCQCDYGAIVSVYESHLKSSHTKSCGCYRKKRSSDLAADLKGRQFGRLKVHEYAETNKNGPLWRCQCSCGKMIVCGADNLRRGKTRSCGCFQEESRKKIWQMRSIS